MHVIVKCSPLTQSPKQAPDQDFMQAIKKTVKWALKLALKRERDVMWTNSDIVRRSGIAEQRMGFTDRYITISGH
jgi:hypothetical protein